MRCLFSENYSKIKALHYKRQSVVNCLFAFQGNLRLMEQKRSAGMCILFYLTDDCQRGKLGVKGDEDAGTEKQTSCDQSCKKLP